MKPDLPCPTCSQPLPTDAPMGLCPNCLFSAGFGTMMNETAAERRRSFRPPAVEEIAPCFPQLEILELLGSGGMGAVYKVRQKHLDRVVALKILPPGIGGNGSFGSRFEREAKALAKLHHPQIVTLYEFGEADGLFYFLMEYVDGVTLRQLLDSGRIPPAEALAIVPQICDALQFAHDRGIVHRDIKPENILLNKDGQVRIADFGVAKIIAGPGSEVEEGPARTGSGAMETQAGGVVGTPAYMAPEQIDHPAEVDHRADIYALGVVFYQMLTGELPAKHVKAPSSKVQIDVRLDEVVLKALEKNPEQRYQHANELRTGVESLAASAASDPAVRPAPGTGVVQRRVRPPAVGLLVVAACNLIAVVYILFEASGESEGIRMGVPFAIWVMGISIAVFGAINMLRLRFHGWACAGAVLAMMLPPSFILGIPVALWALVVLLRRDVREAFPCGAKRANRRGNTGSDMGFGKRRAWVAGGVMLILLFTGVFLFIESFHKEQIGPIGIEPEATIDANAAASDDFRVTFPNGVSVEVMAVCENPRTTNIWRRPDGTPLPEGTLQIESGLVDDKELRGWHGILTPWGISSRLPDDAEGENAPTKEEVLVYVKRDYPLGWPDDLYSRRLEWTPTPFPTRVQRSPNVRWRGDESGTASTDLLSFNEMPEVLDLSMTIPMGPWRPIATFDGKEARVLVDDVKASFKLAPKPQEPEDVALEISHNVNVFRGHGLRLMARLKDGQTREVFISSTGGRQSGDRFESTVLVAGFHGFSPADVKEYELSWTELKTAEIKGIRTTGVKPPPAP